MHSQLFGAAQDDSKQLIASAYMAVSAVLQTSNDHRCGYSTHDGAVAAVSASPEHVATLCSRCRMPGHGSDTCTNACAFCIAAHGHTAECDAQHARLPNKIQQYTDPSVSCAADITTAHADHAPIVSVPPQMQVSHEQLARTCASFEVVQQQVANIMAENSGETMQDAVKTAIQHLAPSAYSTDVQAAGAGSGEPFIGVIAGQPDVHLTR